MAGFLYFIPKFEGKPSDIELREMGLSHLTGAQLSYCACKVGPAGQPGVTFAIDAPEPATRPVVHYKIETQKWEVGDEEKYWVGYEKESTPTAVDLARSKQLSGHRVEMANGDTYLVPAERFLPDRLELDADGCMQRIPKEEFLPMKDLAHRQWADWVEQGTATEEKRTPAEPTMKFAEQLRMVNGFLGINYYVSRVEVNILSIWDDQTLIESIKAILDLPAWRKIMEQTDKKKAEDT